MNTHFCALVGRLTLMLTLCLSVLLAQDITNATADEGCDWTSGAESIQCKSAWWGLSTGCLGIKNESGNAVRFKTTSNDGDNVKRTLGKGKTQRADFKPVLQVHSCKRKEGTSWKKIKCGQVLDIVKNKDSDGGCGCKNFKCLPSW